MENLNNVPSTGTFGGSINQVNQNFGLVKDAIENVEGRTIRSKGLFPTQAALIAAYPSPKVGDYAYVGSSLPATIYDCEVEGTWHNTQQQGGSESVLLNNYPTKSEMNAAIAAIEIETVDNLNEETAASGKALDAHQGFVLAGQISGLEEKVGDEITLTPLTGYWGNAGNIGDQLGTRVTSGTNKTNWRCIKYAVKEGDVLQISGSGGTAGRLWAFADENNSILSVADANTESDGLIIVAPENAAWVVLNSRTEANPVWKYYSAGGLDAHEVYINSLNGQVKELTDSTNSLKDYTVSNTAINLSSYTPLPRCIKVSDSLWTADTDKSHILIPCDNYDSFKITAGANYCVYAWLVDGSRGSNTRPNYANGETGRRIIPAGQTEFTSDRPSDAHYLYITISNVNDFTPSAVYGCAKLGNAIGSNTERINALEGNTGLPYEYLGGKIDMKKYHYQIVKWVAASYTHQSGASYGNYYFMIADKFASIRVIDLANGPVWYGNIWTKPSGMWTSDIYHCNQCTFGTTFYDENDPFPLFYVTANNNSEGRCSQIVFRVIKNGDTFDFVHVQTIYLPVMTSENCLGNANMAIDAERKRMVFYSRDNNAAGYKPCKITEMDIPPFTPVAGDEVQVVTLSETDILTSYFINNTGVYNQGGVVYAGKLFIGRGYASVGAIEITVVDLMTKCQIALLDLYANSFRKEPEGMFVYDNKVCMSTNGDALYRFTFE